MGHPSGPRAPQGRTVSSTTSGCLGAAPGDTGGSLLPPAPTSEEQKEPLAGALSTTSAFSSTSWEPGGRRRLRRQWPGVLSCLVGPLKYGDIAE